MLQRTFISGGQNYNLVGLEGQFFGTMDDVLIYDRALTIEEVEIIYLDQAVTSTNEIVQTGKIKLYPNPSNGLFNITKNNSEEMVYSVFDSKGMQVYSGQCVDNINISHLDAGVYYIRFNVENALITEKVILY
jgi:hypothetical protein